MSKPIVVYYHANCNDGRGAALTAWFKFGNKADYRSIGYYDSFPPKHEFEGKDVFILDFSFELDDMEKLVESANSVTLLDHHKTSMNHLEHFDCSESGCKVVFDMTKSGCVLAYEHFFPGEPIPLMFKYLQDYDLWEHRYDESKYVVQALYSEKFEFRRWKELCENTHVLERLIDKGKILYSHELNMAKGFMKKAWKVQVIDSSPHHNITVVNAPLRLASKLGEVHKNNNEPYPMLVYQEFEKRCGISLRNGHEKVDVGEIASTLGKINNCRGGGHPGASGISPTCHFHELNWK